jgi:hypothetical protein
MNYFYNMIKPKDINVVSINEIVPKVLVYNSIFVFCWFTLFCNKAGRLNEGGQT